MLKYFNIESVKIACLMGKSDPDAHKKSLVFIHGSGGDHTAWLNQLAQLKEKYNIAMIDLPCHGRSEGKGESHVTDYCVWINKLLDVLELDEPIIVGHSLGAAIGLQFAIDYPHKIAGIVCLGGGMKMPVNSFMPEFLKTNPPEMPAAMEITSFDLSMTE
jgi:pimeloyl-ACP methyl ester carboxylesterase